MLLNFIGSLGQLSGDRNVSEIVFWLFVCRSPKVINAQNLDPWFVLKLFFFPFSPFPSHFSENYVHASNSFWQMEMPLCLLLLFVSFFGSLGWQSIEYRAQRQLPTGNWPENVSKTRLSKSQQWGSRERSRGSLICGYLSKNVTQLQQLITHTTRWTQLTLTAALDNNTKDSFFPSFFGVLFCCRHFYSSQIGYIQNGWAKMSVAEPWRRRSSFSRTPYIWVIADWHLWLAYSRCEALGLLMPTL